MLKKNTAQQEPYYSDEVPKIFGVRDRLRVAHQILKVLSIHKKNELAKLKCLDVGSSSGVIANELSKYFETVDAIDVDKKAIKRANIKYNKKNLKFLEMDAQKTTFADSSFDVIILNQVYEFVDDDNKLLNEIYRLLRKGGICYFGARNKFAVIEAQYDIPFLSWIPKLIADVIVRQTKKGTKFIGKYRSYHGLKKLVSHFKIHDYTLKIIRNPILYGFNHLAKISKFAKILPLEYVYMLIPNYIWVLEK